MIIFVRICIKEIIAKGRDFPWPRPDACPCCNGHRIGAMDSWRRFLMGSHVRFCCDGIGVQTVTVC